MNMMTFARRAIKDLEEDNEARVNGKHYVDVSVKGQDGKLYKLAETVPEFIEKIEKKWEVVCCKCILHENACDGSIREIASCNAFKEKQIILFKKK